MHPIAVVQVEYSPFVTDIEDEKIGLLKACRELGVKVVAYGSVGRGLLTGKFVRLSRPLRAWTGLLSATAERSGRFLGARFPQDDPDVLEGELPKRPQGGRRPPESRREAWRVGRPSRNRLGSCARGGYHPYRRHDQDRGASLVLLESQYN